MSADNTKRLREEINRLSSYCQQKPGVIGLNDSVYGVLQENSEMKSNIRKIHSILKRMKDEHQKSISSVKTDVDSRLNELMAEHEERMASLMDEKIKTSLKEMNERLDSSDDLINRVVDRTNTVINIINDLQEKIRDGRAIRR